MVKLWNQEAAQWRLILRFGADKPLSLEMGSEGRTLLVSLGRQDTVTAELVRRAAAKAVKTARELGAESALLDTAGVVEALGAAGLAALAQGAALIQYRRETWKRQEQREFTLYLTGTAGVDAPSVLSESEALTRSICFVRDLVNCPANKLTPQDMAQRMTDAAQRVGIETEVLDEHQARALGMGAFLAVGDSAAHPPRLIVLRYRGGAPDQAPIALVGKGVACDTGGYCIKPAASQKGIKGDMAGGAAVCGTVLALAENRVPINVTAVIPAVENRISPDSFIPGDVIRSMSGKTIEIGNSDAEGRLILADAVTYAIRQEGADRVVDIATLTGAMVKMFGFTTAGFLCNDEALCGAFQEAAVRSGEQYWRLPCFDDYQKMIESPVADLYNTSNDGCGAITAGLFIGSFAEDKPWLHIDIAGTAEVDAPRREYQVKGATGAGVSTLYELCRGLAGPA